MEERDKKQNNDEHGEDVSLGPVIAIIVIVTVLIIGGLFVFKKKLPRENTPTENSISRDSVINDFARQGSSDSLDEIRKDLSATSINALDRDLGPIDPQVDSKTR